MRKEYLPFSDIQQMRELNAFRRERVIAIDEKMAELRAERAKVIRGCSIKAIAEKFDLGYTYATKIIKYKARANG